MQVKQENLMPENETPSAEEVFAELRSRAEALERQLEAVRQETESRLVRSEMKAEAIRAGMIDLDGLKLLDLSGTKLNDRGEVDCAAALMDRLKREKPWLFGGNSSSSTSSLPPPKPPRQKTAMEMTEAEYRAARAELLKRRF
jgi:hypothetical protein